LTGRDVHTQRMVEEKLKSPLLQARVVFFVVYVYIEIQKYIFEIHKNIYIFYPTLVSAPSFWLSLFLLSNATTSDSTVLL